MLGGRVWSEEEILKRFGSWFFPDGEEHLQEWMTKMHQPCFGRLGYQKHKYDLAMKFVKQKRLGVDVGGHVGLWSWPMSWDFEQVKAFEPMSEHYACWLANMRERDNATVYHCALGETEGRVSVRTRTPGSSGDTGVDPKAENSSLRASVDLVGESVEQRRLDDFKLDNVDFLKIDCEGYELFVLRGAKETLLRCKPCVIVEQKAETGGSSRYGIGVYDGVDFLKGLGAKSRAGLQGDYILSWD